METWEIERIEKMDPQAKEDFLNRLHNTCEERLKDLENQNKRYGKEFLRNRLVTLSFIVSALLIFGGPTMMGAGLMLAGQAVAITGIAGMIGSTYGALTTDGPLEKKAKTDVVKANNEEIKKLRERMAEIGKMKTAGKGR